MIDLEAIKRACALVRANGQRGTAYLIHAKWAVTCEHVVRGVTRVKLEFPADEHGSWNGEAWGTVYKEKDETGDVALIELEKPVERRPLRLTTVQPILDTQCWMVGFPTEAKESQLPFKGVIRDPHGRDFDQHTAIAIYSNEASAGDGAKLSGLSGGPVVMGQAVVGHLKKVLGQDGKAIFGRAFASHSARVLALLPPDLRDELAVPDFDAFRKQMCEAVARMLENDAVARRALGPQIELSPEASAREVSERLFERGCVAMLAACTHAHDKLVQQRNREADASAERIEEVALVALPALHELGALAPSSNGAATLLMVEAADETGTELLVARHDGRRAFIEGESGRGTRAAPRIADMTKLEMGKVDWVKPALAAAREQLAKALRVDCAGLDDDAIDEEINGALRYRAAGQANTRRYRCYYVFSDRAQFPFAEALASAYPALHVVRFRRKRSTDGSHHEIKQGVEEMLSRRLRPR